MTSRPRSFAAHAAIVALLAAPTLGAQQSVAFETPSALVPSSLVAAPSPASRATPADSARPVGGAPLAGASAAVRAPARSLDAAPALAAPAGSLRQSQVLMVVGGAAILIGALAGGDAQAPLVVGGAVIGLYGLYQYLR